MISIHRIETLAKGLKLHPATLRCILTGRRHIPFEAFAELDRRLDALGWNLRPLNGGEPRRQAH